MVDQLTAVSFSKVAVWIPTTGVDTENDVRAKAALMFAHATLHATLRVSFHLGHVARCHCGFEPERVFDLDCAGGLF